MSESSKRNVITQLVLGQSLRSIRLLAGVVVVTYVSLFWVLSQFAPEIVDPLWIRAAITAMVGIFFISTYFSYGSPRYIAYVSLSLYFLVLGHSLYLALINQFHPTTATLLILTIGGGTVLINHMALYIIQSVAIILFSLALFQGKPYTNADIISFTNVVIAIGVFGIVFLMRIKLTEKLSFSDSLFSKLNVLTIIANKSGEVIFVSPSINSMLGYNASKLLKTGWWQNENLTDGWIRQEDIRNYPNILPEELRENERSVETAEGKTVWLKWTNSILPNGNYVGVAADVTDYKNIRAELEIYKFKESQ